MHGKRRVAEADGPLSAHELAERVCSAFDCPHHEHLSLPEKVAYHALGRKPLLGVSLITRCHIDRQNAASPKTRSAFSVVRRSLALEVVNL
nr:hypothetical protein [Actinomycetota bacterium]